MEFSVLIAVYKKENPIFFQLAMESIWQNQTLKPTEIVLVKDGGLTPELEKIIDHFANFAPLKIHSLAKNSGLGVALAEGLKICSHELIARMDSDDISAPDRFEKQLKFMSEHPEIDISGCFIAEFNTSTDHILSYRKLPIEQDEIIHFAKKRNPLNHMTVIFKKNSVLKAGNYKPFFGYEDYYLWVRMIMNGAKMHNIPEALVFARIGNNMHSRRQGFDFFKQEVKLQNELHRINFLNNKEYLSNLTLRPATRLLPIWGLKLVYKHLRK